MNNDLISREALKGEIRNPNDKRYLSERIISLVFERIDNAPTVFFDWEKSDAYLDCVKRIMSLEKENEELRQFLKNQGVRE